MSESISGIYLIMLVLFGLYLIARRAKNDTTEEHPQDDFAFLTVREQIAAAKETSDALGEAEQLITDMAECTADDVVIVRVEWIGHDDEKHLLELYCDGTNTAAECLSEIGEREAYELQNILARQCAVLAEGGRHRKNSRKNDPCQRGEAAAIDEIMSEVRHGDLRG